MDDLPSRTWCVEVVSKDASLEALMDKVRSYLDRTKMPHEVVVQDSARIVVQFATFDEANRFFWMNNGRFVRYPEIEQGDCSRP